MAPDKGEIIRAFTEGAAAERQAVLRDLPPSITRDIALQLAASDEPSVAVIALDQVAADHVGGRAPQTGLALALACFEVCRRLHDSGAGSPQVFVNTAGRNVHFAVTVLRRDGQAAAIRDLLDDALPWLTDRGHRSHLGNLIIARIEACLDLCQRDRAAALLAEVPEQLRARDVRFASLRRRIDSPDAS